MGIVLLIVVMAVLITAFAWGLKFTGPLIEGSIIMSKEETRLAPPPDETAKDPPKQPENPEPKNSEPVKNLTLDEKVDIKYKLMSDSQRKAIKELRAGMPANPKRLAYALGGNHQVTLRLIALIEKDGSADADETEPIEPKETSK